MRKVSIYSEIGRRVYHNLTLADIDLEEDHIYKLIVALGLIGTFYFIVTKEGAFSQAFKVTRYHNKKVKIRSVSRSEMKDVLPSCPLLA